MWIMLSNTLKSKSGCRFVRWLWTMLKNWVTASRYPRVGTSLEKTYLLRMRLRFKQIWWTKPNICTRTGDPIRSEFSKPKNSWINSIKRIMSLSPEKIWTPYKAKQLQNAWLNTLTARIYQKYWKLRTRCNFFSFIFNWMKQKSKLFWTFKHLI